ncbi:ABC transporter [bacterium]|nr:MAG: ABC transporter [bacterium]
MANENTPVIEVRDLDFAYGHHPVLRNVNVTIDAGSFVSIVGPNGGGKSTLLKLVLGLLRPDRGDVRIMGQSPRQARRQVGYMPQHAHVDPRFPVTVTDVVLMGRLGPGRSIGPYRSEDRDGAQQALAETNAADLAKRRFSDLSGGQRQRVLIARALACEPGLLLLDEPTASLDPGVQDDLFELLNRLNDRMTVVLVSHDVGVVSQYVDKILCVNGAVDEHDSSAISGALADLYRGNNGLALVRHDHSHGFAADHGPDHDPEDNGHHHG